MRNERGSALVGVLAITLILSISAASFLFSVGNASKDTQIGATDQTLHYAAESAMLMGARWVRTHKYDDIATDWIGEFVMTNLGGGDYYDIGGVKARVSIWCIPGGPKRILKTIATTGPNRDILTIQWTIEKVITDPADPQHKCIPSFSGWQETYTPGIP